MPHGTQHEQIADLHRQLSLHSFLDASTEGLQLGHCNPACCFRPPEDTWMLACPVSRGPVDLSESAASSGVGPAGRRCPSCVCRALARLFVQMCAGGASHGPRWPPQGLQRRLRVVPRMGRRAAMKALSGTRVSGRGHGTHGTTRNRRRGGRVGLDLRDRGDHTHKITA